MLASDYQTQRTEDLMEQGRMAGKRALVVGGSPGIGSTIAERFRDEGADVVVADLHGGDVEVDVRDVSLLARAVDQAVERLDGLDTLIYNAGVVPVGGVESIDVAAWSDAMRINVDGAFASARAAWPHLKDGGGAILATASGAGIRAMPDRIGYCTSKAALVMLTQCLALEGAPYGVRANAVCPGFVDTPSMRRSLEEAPDPDHVLEYMALLHPIGRMGVPRDVADAFVYLASDEAAWVTGVILPVDGGLTAGLRLGT
ncbi:MAG: SDR family oxidoreductase [Actinomycetota bacterium]|nr:SDR family oxidoreductase [Actinomycetota bacterium]